MVDNFTFDFFLRKKNDQKCFDRPSQRLTLGSETVWIVLICVQVQVPLPPAGVEPSRKHGGPLADELGPAGKLTLAPLPMFDFVIVSPNCKDCLWSLKRYANSLDVLVWVYQLAAEDNPDSWKLWSW